jgi:hypothetical protein
MSTPHNQCQPMTDLVVRLRAAERGNQRESTYKALCGDAADAINAITARVAELEAALRPFFLVLRQTSSFVKDAYQIHITKDDYEKSRAALDKAAGGRG